MAARKPSTAGADTPQSGPAPTPPPAAEPVQTPPPPAASAPAPAPGPAPAEGAPAGAPASGGRKPWVKKTPVEVVLEQIGKQEEKVNDLREELKKEETQLQKLQQAKKVLEAVE